MASLHEKALAVACPTCAASPDSLCMVTDRDGNMVCRRPSDRAHVPRIREYLRTHCMFVEDKIR